MNIREIPDGIKWSIFQEKLVMFRCLTLLAFIIAFIIEKYINSEGRPFALFGLIMIISGMSLFNAISQAGISFVVSAAITYLSPIGLSKFMFHGVSHFILNFTTIWFSHFAIGVIISYLIKIHINEHKNTMNFVKTLAKTLESKDSYTASHSLNVAKYSKIIAERLHYSKKDCDTIFIGALLHDIGKIGIKDNILNKPARLTAEEYTSIKQHPVIGYDMLKLIKSFEQNKTLEMVLFHHERYDGKGYPYGLKGNEIPEAAAIISVADAFDAMNSRRIYRDGYELNYSINELLRNSGMQFNPHIVNTFVDYLKDERADILYNGINIKVV